MKWRNIPDVLLGITLLIVITGLCVTYGCYERKRHAKCIEAGGVWEKRNCREETITQTVCTMYDKDMQCMVEVPFTTTQMNCDNVCVGIPAEKRP